LTNPIARVIGFSALAALGLAMAGPGGAQTADLILLHGRILTLDERSSVREAMAVSEGRIAALGRSTEIMELAGRKTRVVDLRGRTVIPGLIDSHIHAIRAALSYSVEVNWIGTSSLEEALGRIREAARTAKPGDWIIVAGGWTPEQFREKRRPTQSELAAVAGEHPAYVQLFYAWALMTPAAFKALNIATDADVGPRGKLDEDADGKKTGGISGDTATITALFSRLPSPSFEQRVAGTRAFFRELNRLALTGVVDPGGFGMAPRDYQALFKLWQDKALTLRVVYTVFAQKRGSELEDYRNLTQLLPMGMGDEMLRFNGIGENVAWGMYNNDNPSEADKAQFYEIAKWAAERRMSLNMHWHNDRSVGQLLDIFERVDRESPIKGLRWAIAHLNDASAATLERMKALGVGWAMQDGRPPRATAQDRAQDRRECRGGYRRAPRGLVQSVRCPALDARRQDRRRHALAWTGRGPDARGGAAHVHAGQRVVCARRGQARFAGRGQARRSRGLVQGLHESATRGHREDRVPSDHGRGKNRVCRRALRGIRGEPAALRRRGPGRGDRFAWPV